MPTKLNIDLSKGTLEVEGDDELIREVYRDFKDRLLAPQSAGAINSPETAGVNKSASIGRRGRTATKRSSAGGASPPKKAGIYTPKFDPNLDLKDLESFYDQYEPKNNYERVLLFAIFLKDHLSKAPCSADEIFSCFHRLKSKFKVPTAFSQGLIDCRGKLGYINYETYDAITVTTAGENHFNHEMSKANAG